MRLIQAHIIKITDAQRLALLLDVDGALRRLGKIDYEQFKYLLSFHKPISKKEVKEK